MTFLALLLPFWNGVKAFAGTAFTFLTTKPGVYLLMAGIALGAYWYSGHEGYKRGVSETVAAAKLAQTRTEVAALDKGKKLQASIDAAMADDAFAAGEADGKARAKTLIITKEVPKYVTVEIDRAFPVPCSLVLLHDAAAIGADPQALGDAACGPDGKTSTLKASDLAAVIVANYGIDHEKDAQIIGLQALARTLAAGAEQ